MMRDDDEEGPADIGDTPHGPGSALIGDDDA